MPVTTSPSTVTAAQAAPVSPSSTTPPIPIPARNDGYRPLDHNSTAFGHLLDAQDGIEIPPPNHPFHQFARRRNHPLALLFDELPVSSSQTRHEPMLLPVSFSPTHSSLSLSPPMSPSSQPVVHHENEPCNWVQKDNWEPRFQDTQEVTERKRWPSSSLLIRDVPTSYSVPVSSNYAGSSRSLPGSRHHYRNSLRALRNMTLLPGGIRISRETGEDLAPVFDFDEDSLNGGDENAGIGTASSRSLRLLCLESSMEGVGSSRTSQRTSKTRRGHKRSATAPHILTNSLRTAALHRV